MKSIVKITCIALSIFMVTSCNKKTQPVSVTQNVSPALEKQLLSKLRVLNDNMLKSMQNSGGKTGAKTTGVIPYANPNNPYDSTGFYHNQCLDYLQSYLDATHDSVNALTFQQDGIVYSYSTYVSKSVAVVAKYAHEHNFNYGGQPNQPQSYATIYANLYAVYTAQNKNRLPLQQLDNFCGTGDPDSVADRFYTEWIQAAYSQSPMDDSIQTLLKNGIRSIAFSGGTAENNINNVLALIIQYENTIVANPNSLSVTSYNSELIGLSVLRYSNYYWYNIQITPASKWMYYYSGILTGVNNNNGFHKTTSWAGLWHGFAVCAADGMGAVIGAGGTAPSGPGAVVAGIFVAAVCSGLMESCFG